MNHLGDQIKHLRTARKMTQAEFAERISVTKSAVSAYENDTRLPSYDVLIQISRLFHVSVDYLLGCSEKTTLDVTGLTQEQVNTIQDIVESTTAWRTKPERIFLPGMKIFKCFVRYCPEQDRRHDKPRSFFIFPAKKAPWTFRPGRLSFS